MDSSKPNPQSKRVLIRPPIPPSPSQSPSVTPSHAQFQPPPSTSSDAPATSPAPLNPQSGIVVVGFIGKRYDDVAYLMNRIIDSNVFGSGGLDKPIFVDKPDEKTDFVVTDDVKSWFECRNISYYHDEEKGMLFLQFSSTRCPMMEGNLESKMGFDSLLEDYEYGDLQAMLFMFSVTPHFPIILAANPVIQFEESCLPPSVPDHNKKLQFCLGCQVILPPESFLSLRLPFIYGVQLENGSVYPLMPFEQQPELTAWISKGTTLQLVSKDSIHEELFTQCNG